MAKKQQNYNREAGNWPAIILVCRRRGSVIERGYGGARLERYFGLTRSELEFLSSGQTSAVF